MAAFEGDRRKNYFIDPRFQAEFILKFCSLVIAASVVTGFLIYYLNRYTATVTFDDLRVIVKTTSDFILPVMLEVLAIVFLFTGIATVAIMLFASHRIAGPLYKLMTELKKMEGGDFTSSIHIRATDQLQKAARETEAMRVKVSGELDSIKKDWGALKQGLSKVRDRGGENEKAGIDDTVKKIDAALSRFKTGL